MLVPLNGSVLSVVSSPTTAALPGNTPRVATRAIAVHSQSLHSVMKKTRHSAAIPVSFAQVTLPSLMWVEVFSGLSVLMQG